MAYLNSGQQDPNLRTAISFSASRIQDSLVAAQTFSML